jgi:transcriptional regulator GlxA family with amidase domain
MPTNPAKPHKVCIAVFPGFQLLDATGPAQVFATAADEMPAQRPYDVRIVSQQGGLVRSSSGIALDTGRWPSARELDGATFIVAGGAGVAEALRDAGLLRRVVRASARAGRCCSVCTGAFLLAQAGLLDGRRAVTHWRDAETFRRLYPQVKLHDDAIHVKDGAVYTSAGVTAGIDLCLAMVEEDLGRAMALRVAKRLVVHMKRPGGQRQFSADLLAQSADDGLGGRLAAWLRPRLRQRLAVADMAAALALSPRSLHRHLSDELGATPAQLLAQLRLEAACRLLEAGRVTVKEVVRRTGFQSEDNLRRAFVKRLGVAPSDYKARFG